MFVSHFKPKCLLRLGGNQMFSKRIKYLTLFFLVLFVSMSPKPCVAFNPLDLFNIVVNVFTFFEKVDEYLNPDPDYQTEILNKIKDLETQIDKVKYNEILENIGKLEGLEDGFKDLKTIEDPDDQRNAQFLWVNDANIILSSIEQLILNADPDTAMAYAASYNAFLPLLVLMKKELRIPALELLTDALKTNASLLGNHCFNWNDGFPCHRAEKGKIFAFYNKNGLPPERWLPSTEYFEAYKTYWHINEKVRSILYDFSTTWFTMENLRGDFLHGKDQRVTIIPYFEYGESDFQNYLWRFEFDKHGRIDKIRHYSGECLDPSDRNNSFELKPCADVNVFYDIFSKTIENSAALWVSSPSRDIKKGSFLSDDRLRHYLYGYAHGNLQWEFMERPEDYFHENEKERHCYWYGSECAHLWDIGTFYYPIRIHIKTQNGHYWYAENGGGGQINATRKSPGTWETFSIIDVNKGALESGDVVYLKTYNNHFVTAINGGGDSMYADRTAAGEWESFKIIKIDGVGVINIGDNVAFQAPNGDYVCAEDGGGGEVNANRPSVRQWETHQLLSSYK